MLVGSDRIIVDLLLGIVASSFVAELDITLPLGTHKSIPENEEWLGKVVLDAPALVMDVMVRGIVRCDFLQGIPREGIAAMVIDCLDGGHREEPHALTVGQSSGQEPHASASCVEKETLHRMVVQSTKGVRNIKAMVTGMEFD